MGKPRQAKRALQSEFPILDSLGLVAAPIKGDGNCLFRALSDQFFGQEGQYPGIRDSVVKHLSANSSKFSAFVGEYGESFDQYLSRMSQDGCYGGHMEIVAFAESYRRCVVIYQAETLFIVNPLSLPENEPSNMVHVAYHTWEHYSSVRPKSGPFRGPVLLEIPTVIKYVKDAAGMGGSNEVPQWKVNIVTRSVPDADEEAVRKLLCSLDYEDVIEKLIMSEISLSDDGEHDKDTTTVDEAKANVPIPAAGRSSEKPKGKRRGKPAGEAKVALAGTFAMTQPQPQLLQQAAVVGSGGEASIATTITDIAGSEAIPKLSGKQKREERKHRVRVRKALAVQSAAHADVNDSSQEEIKAKIMHI